VSHDPFGQPIDPILRQVGSRQELYEHGGINVTSAASDNVA
jgi:hypothetical protein